MDLSIWKAVRKHSRIAAQRLSCAFCNLQSKLVCKKGQGTTEYAILVGVLVVIAILAIAVFKPKLQELWDAISDGMNSL